jgi:hypothetical protein
MTTQFKAVTALAGASQPKDELKVAFDLAAFPRSVESAGGEALAAHYHHS